MSAWSTRFAVLAEHFPDRGAPPRLSAGHCELLVSGSEAWLACRSDETDAGFALALSPEGREVMLCLHDAVVPRLRVLPGGA